MTVSRRTISLGGLGLLAATSLPPAADALDGPLVDLVEGSDEFGIAVEAYTYGYPLVTMEMTRRVMTNVAEPTAPRARWASSSSCANIPTPAFRDVTAPERRHALHDGLARCRQGALGRSASPTSMDRYFLFPMLDGWTDVFQVPGKRTTGTQAADLRDHRPGLEGQAARRA